MSSPHEPDYLDHGPTVSRVLLGTQLRRLREEAGVSPQTAGERIRASHAKISRLELGRVGFKLRDIEDLLDLYEVADPAVRSTFLSMAARSNERGWWSRDSDLVQGWFEMYLRLEQEARSVRTYQAQLLPGLLQCETYAHTVLRTLNPAAPAHEIDRRAQLRLARQKMLIDADGPSLWAIVDESAFSRQVGSPAVMRTQLQHLLDVMARPNITVQVLPFLAGGHAAMGGPFSILRFAQRELPDIVYLEHYKGASYLDRRAEVEDYLWAIEQLGASSLTPAASRAHITALLGRA